MYAAAKHKHTNRTPNTTHAVCTHNNVPAPLPHYSNNKQHCVLRHVYVPDNYFNYFHRSWSWLGLCRSLHSSILYHLLPKIKCTCEVHQNGAMWKNEKTHTHTEQTQNSEYGSSASNAAAGFHKICASDVKIMPWLSNDLEHILYWMNEMGQTGATEPDDVDWMQHGEEIAELSLNTSSFSALNYNCLIRVLDQIVCPVKASIRTRCKCNYSLLASFLLYNFLLHF